MIKKLTTTLAIVLGLFFLVSIASASDTELLQPASTITYNEDLTVNGTGKFNSVYIGETGVGGVTFFNGTIVNIDQWTPVTFGDDVRIDGEIWRGPAKGTSDNMPLKISDTIIPTLSNTNDLGSSSNRWRDIYFSGTLHGTVTSDNILDGTIKGSDINTGTNITANNFIANSYEYSSEKQRYLTIPANSLIPHDETNVYHKTDNMVNLTDERFYAPVYLPDNAVVKSFHFNIYRNTTSGSIWAILMRQHNDDPDTTDTLVGIMSPSSTLSYWIEEIDNEIEYATIDNDNYAYFVKVFFSAADADLRAGPIEIKYTVNSPH